MRRPRPLRALKRYRDALTGRITTRADAEARPGQTVAESIDRPRVDDRRVDPDSSPFREPSGDTGVPPARPRKRRA